MRRMFALAFTQSLEDPSDVIGCIASDAGAAAFFLGGDAPFLGPITPQRATGTGEGADSLGIFLYVFSYSNTSIWLIDSERGCASQKFLLYFWEIHQDSWGWFFTFELRQWLRDLLLGCAPAISQDFPRTCKGWGEFGDPSICRQIEVPTHKEAEPP